MKILYVIALICFFVLAWVALAIARHIRKGEPGSATLQGASQRVTQRADVITASERAPDKLTLRTILPDSQRRHSS